MAIINKIQQITNFFGNMFSKKSSSGYDNYGYNSSNRSVVTITKDAFIAFTEKYKGVRRTILAIVLWINIHIFFVTIEMYRRTTTVDTQWVIFAGYWTAILGTFIAFYTLSRVKEFHSNTPYSNKGEWLSENTPNAAVTTTTYTTTEFDDEDLSLYDGGEEEEDA